MSLEVGTTVDRYVVERPIGRGGMATVWQVRHAQLGSRHALKVLHAAGPGMRDRLLQEGRIQARIRHPNLVLVTDVVDVGGAPGLILELVEGPDLEQWLARTRPSLAQIDALAAGILEGLAAAHAAGLVHRDLKPGNILLAVEGSALTPKITDFGLARVLAGEGAGGNQTRGVMGTPSYMAPEQIQDTAGVDARADVFSIGAVLYELATGQRCFPGSDVFAVFERIRSGRYAPPQEVAPELPDRIARAIERALVVDPDQRIASCEALREAWGGEVRSNPWGAGDLAGARGGAAGSEGGNDPTVSSPRLVGAKASTPSSAPEPTRGGPARSPLPEVATGGLGSVRWRLVAAPVVMLVVLVAAWASWPRPREVFTIEGAPKIDAPASVQADLEGAWLAWQDGDMARATRLSHQVVVAAPEEPMAYLMYGFAAAQHGDLLEMARALKRFEPLVERLDPAGPAQGALDIFTAFNGPHALERCAQHAAKWPEDLLVATMCAVRAPGEPDELVARAHALRERAPQLVVAWVTEVGQLVGAGRIAESNQVLDEALVHHPDAAPLLLLRAELHRFEAGDLAAARADVARAIELDPGLTGGRSFLAQLELEAGRRQAFEVQDAVLRSDVTSAFDRAIHANQIAGVHLAWGRVGEALRYLDLVREAQEERGDVIGLADTHEGRFAILLEQGDVEGAHLEWLHLGASLSVPEFPDDIRALYIARHLGLSAQLAVARGDFELARAEQRRADEAGASLGVSGDVELAIAVARRDTRRVVELLSAGDPVPCATDLSLGLSLAEVGAWEDAGPPLDRWHAMGDACGSVVATRSERALVALRRAQVAQHTGRLAARVSLAEFHGLWPDFDPNWRLAGEVAALDAALATP